jgi:NAD-dependent histone deacetylase SIR2
MQNYTQNIDTLETLAGVKRVLQCHGSFATASCVQCRQKVQGTDIEDDILNRRVPLCPGCNAAPTPKAEHKKSKKKKKSAGWRSDESESDEPDIPDYPPGIMKVRPITLLVFLYLSSNSSARYYILRRETYR